MNLKPSLRGQHAIKLFVSTELKARLSVLSDELGRPLADVARTLIWMGLPIMEGMDAAHRRGSRWWLNRVSGKSVDALEEIT
jgi:predicted DNA-binding protein